MKSGFVFLVAELS